ncbi:MAG TPA: prepilin peptidase [Chloroflexota bacterium]|nr:prepilin peptidase [Chloroflexota bacterium]
MGTLDLLLKGGVVVLLIAGAATDLRSRRIPNAITLGGALLGFVVNVALHQQQGALSSLGGWALGVALLAIPFILGGMGAGDVKLLALAGAWGGPAFALYTFLCGAIVGGIIAVGLLVVNRRVGETVRPVTTALRMQLVWLLGSVWPRALELAAVESGSARETPRATGRRVQFPYGPALAIGGLIALLVR